MVKYIKYIALLYLIISCGKDNGGEKYEDISVSINIKNDEKDVSISKDIVIDFSDKVVKLDGSEINDKSMGEVFSFREEDNKGKEVAFNISIANDKKKITIKHNVLRKSTKYYFKVDGKKLKGAKGEKVKVKKIVFTTRADDSKDISISININNDEKDVSISKDIVIDFSDKVVKLDGSEINDKNMGEVFSFREGDSKGKEVVFDISIANDKKKITIKPKVLNKSTKYYFQVDGKKLKSAKGEKVIGKEIFFTTEDGLTDPLKITDPLYKDQWYLKNTGKFGGMVGIDINVEPVWKQGYKGKGMFIGILDDFVQRTHPDLKDNLPAGNFIDYYSDVSYKQRTHGTSVAGIIAARDNTIGIHGIASRATLYAYGVNGGDKGSSNTNSMEKSIVLALSRAERTKIAVYNASIGTTIERKYENIPADLKQAIEQVLKNGFGGKGSSLVFAAGNLGNFGSPANSFYLNHYGTMGINTVAKDGQAISGMGGTWGPNLWLGAPSTSTFGTHLITTDLVGADGKPGDYSNFSSTSGATPMVSGVIALLREAYPELTWRDVKLILAESARKITHDKRVYFTTGKMYSNSAKEQKYSLRTGFGLVDAEAAFKLAKNWSLLPTEKVETHEQKTPLNTPKTHTYGISELDITSSLTFIESVTLQIEVETILDDGKGNVLFYDRDLVLVAPDGKESYIFQKKDNPLYGYSYFKVGLTNLSFLSNGFLGNDRIAGKWKLKIRQTTANRAISKIKNWKLIIRGH